MSHSLTQINKDEIICLLSDDGAESDAAAAAEDDNSNRNVPPPRDKPNNARNSEADDQAVIESDEDDDNKNSARLRKSSPFVAFTDKVKPKEQSTKASSSSSKGEWKIIVWNFGSQSFLFWDFSWVSSDI